MIGETARDNLTGLNLRQNCFTISLRVLPLVYRRFRHEKNARKLAERKKQLTKLS